jgi:YVTN family beta-propeller protein
MSLETEIREAFERHATDARPRTETWSEIGRRIERGHRMRTIGAALGAAAAIATAVLVFPRIDEATVPVVPIETTGWQIFRSDLDGYSLLHPTDWEIQPERSARMVTMVPASVLSIKDGSIPFLVSVTLNSGNYAEFERPQDSIVKRVTIGDRAAFRVESEFEAGNLTTKLVQYRIDWTNVRCPEGPPCSASAEGMTLRVEISAHDRDFWPVYGPAAERMVGTIRPARANIAEQPRVAARIPVAAIDLAARPDALWALEGVGSKNPSVVRIDPRTNRVAARIPVGSAPKAIAVDADAVWVINGTCDGDQACLSSEFSQGSVMKIDPASNKKIAEVPLEEPEDVAVGFDSDGKEAIWVTASGCCDGDKTLLRIDPATNDIVARISFGPASGPARVLSAGDHVWVVAQSPDDRTTVFRIDPRTDRVIGQTTVPGGSFPPDLASSSGALWVTTSGPTSPSAVAKIDLSTGKVVATVLLQDAAPVGLTSVASSVDFVLAGTGRGYLYRVHPVTLFPVGDPLLIGDPAPIAIEKITYDDFSRAVWVASGDGTIFRFEP